MIYSASGIYAQQELGDSLFFLKRQLLVFMIGFVATCVVMMVDYRDLRPYVKPLLLLTIVLLGLVLIPGVGKESYGARRWFRLGPFHFQPSEMMKITLLLYAADYLDRKQSVIRNFWKGFTPMIIVLGVVCLLIIRQPDLGSAVLLSAMVFVFLFVAGVRLALLMSIGALALPVLGYLVMTESYRLRRIVSFLNPWADKEGAGFQLVQSQIALGSGGLWGVGPGQSVQKLYYLPAAHTDFIFSIIGEELGLLGTLAVVLLFMAFIWQGARLAKRVQDPFGYFIVVGIVFMISAQAIINIGVSIGALPTKGLTLPFISYGGSALIFNMVMIGLLLNVSRAADL
jgi:cell division protein FtsW